MTKLATVLIKHVIQFQSVIKMQNSILNQQ